MSQKRSSTRQEGRASLISLIDLGTLSRDVEDPAGGDAARHGMPDADETALQRMVAGGVVEDVDLEFKEGPYGRDDQGKHELSKDVAAMANMRGGVILLGIHADAGTAAQLTPFRLEEAEELRMRQLLASSVAPVPTFEIHPVTSDGTTGAGYYLLVVARTSAAPHAVVRDSWLG